MSTKIYSIYGDKSLQNNELKNKQTNLLHDH